MKAAQLNSIQEKINNLQYRLGMEEANSRHIAFSLIQYLQEIVALQGEILTLLSKGETA